MKVEVILHLQDKPGMLLRVLEPISQFGGNILSLHHERARSGNIPVDIIFKVKDESTLDCIIAELKEKKLNLKEVKTEGRKYYRRKTLSLVFIGHVIDKDIQDTIDRLNKIGLVGDVDVRMNDPDEESSVWMSIDVEEKKAKKLSLEIEEIVKKKKFLAITEVGGL